VSFRNATLDDAPILYSWRRQAESKRWYKGRKTTAAAHLDWLARRLNNPLVRILIWQNGVTPAGMVRIDSNGEIAFHAVDDDTAVRMLKATHVYASQYGGRLKATVDRGNPDRKLLAHAGYRDYPAAFMAYKK